MQCTRSVAESFVVRKGPGWSFRPASSPSGATRFVFGQQSASKTLSETQIFDYLSTDLQTTVIRNQVSEAAAIIFLACSERIWCLAWRHDIPCCGFWHRYHILWSSDFTVLFGHLMRVAELLVMGQINIALSGLQVHWISTTATKRRSWFKDLSWRERICKVERCTMSGGPAHHVVQGEIKEWTKLPLTIKANGGRFSNVIL